MYKPFYGLQTSPFKINTDPTFLWLGEKHREAISMLKYGIMGDGHSGILLLTGEAGTGKTTLINALFKSLGRDVLRVAISNPSLEGLDFLNYVAASFGSKKQFGSKSHFLIAFERFLKNAREKNKKVLLVVDEAQLLSNELLEEVRLLSNFTEDGESLLHTFLVGQQELRRKLAAPKNNSLSQRITLNYNIDPLVAAETEEYIKYRLQVAGTAEPIFNPDAVQEIHRFSRGLPRQINIICDHCLLTGYVRNTRQVSVPIVRECMTDLAINPAPTQTPLPGQVPQHGQAPPTGQAPPAYPPPPSQAQPVQPQQVRPQEAYPQTGPPPGTHPPHQPLQPPPVPPEPRMAIPKPEERPEPEPVRDAPKRFLKKIKPAYLLYMVVILAAAGLGLYFLFF